MIKHVVIHYSGLWNCRARVFLTVCGEVDLTLAAQLGHRGSVSPKIRPSERVSSGLFLPVVFVHWFVAVLLHAGARVLSRGNFFNLETNQPKLLRNRNGRHFFSEFTGTKRILFLYFRIFLSFSLFPETFAAVPELK